MNRAAEFNHHRINLTSSIVFYQLNHKSQKCIISLYRLSLLRLSQLYLEGNSEIGAQVRSNICHLICSRHLIRSRVQPEIVYFFSENTFFITLYIKLRPYWTNDPIILGEIPFFSRKSEDITPM